MSENHLINPNVNLSIAGEKIEVILKDHKVKYGYEFTFPRFGKDLPDEVLLALKVMKHFGMQVGIVLEEDKEKKV
jgi:hypothetical protein